MADNWRAYEAEIMELLRDEYPQAQINRDQKRVGRFSKVERQIDILIEGQIAGNRGDLAAALQTHRGKGHAPDLD